MRKWYVICTVCAIACAVSIVNALNDATCPNTFASGETITAAKMNQNFDSLELWTAKTNDTLDAKFVRFTDTSSVWHVDTMKLYADIYTTDWTTHTATLTGFKGTPTQHIAYKKVGKFMYIVADIQGYSKYDSLTFTLPDTCRTLEPVYATCRIADNDTFRVDPGLVYIAGGGKIAKAYKTLAAGAWTTDSTKQKQIQAEFFYGVKK